MSNHDGQDKRDPLRAESADHQCTPRDVVPHTEHSLDDLRRMVDGAAPVTVTHNEIFEVYGVIRHTEHATITRPIINTGKVNL